MVSCDSSGIFRISAQSEPPGCCVRQGGSYCRSTFGFLPLAIFRFTKIIEFQISYKINPSSPITAGPPQRGDWRSEVRCDQFQPVVSLPAQLQKDKAKAALKDGLLTPRTPKLGEKSSH
ncbi:MAG: Hsp20 family protein [Oscillatoria princeps RMCB-10]|nr:Hsp20 family protein [Oscillatoria princeps RMCB-10]